MARDRYSRDLLGRVDIVVSKLPWDHLWARCLWRLPWCKWCKWWQWWHLGRDKSLKDDDLDTVAHAARHLIITNYQLTLIMMIITLSSNCSTQLSSTTSIQSLSPFPILISEVKRFIKWEQDCFYKMFFQRYFFRMTVSKSDFQFSTWHLSIPVFSLSTGSPTTLSMQWEQEQYGSHIV